MTASRTVRRRLVFVLAIAGVFSASTLPALAAPQSSAPAPGGPGAASDPARTEGPQSYVVQTPGAGQTGRWFDNLSLFVGPDGSKQPQDLGINANMGIRFSGNIGFPLLERAGIGAQIGAALNLSDAAVHVLDQVEGTSRRTQTYLTLGVFQRASEKWNWAVAYDVLVQQYYDDFKLAQWRGQLGYAVTPRNEVGLWVAKSAKGDDGLMADTPVRLDPISQINGYTRITWTNLAQTAVWVGMASHHNNVVWVFPDNSKDDHVLVYGADLYVPLNERFGLQGAANFLTPTATGTVDAYLGVVFYPGRGAFRAVRNAFAPLQTVANNPSFSVNLRR
ncbi:MAG TPA: DUF6666 family protein [Vicinamibacterales bacterium]|jgi:hypothetical protein